MAKQPLLLMILDGWGIAPAGQYNAAALAKTPNLDALFDKYPHTRLSCSGAAVGLPDGQMGNSEVGHLNIGSGTQIAAQSGITSNMPEKSVLRGSPAFDYPKYQKCYVMFRKLPELYGQIKDLEKEVNKLKSE